MSLSPPGSDSTPKELRGARVFVLRGGAWGERVAEQISLRGGDAVVVPLLDIQFTQPSVLRSALEDWATGNYDWLLLTSANTVHAIENCGADLSLRESARGGGRTPRIAAVGPITAEAAERLGLTVSLTPQSDFSAEGLINALRKTVGDRPLRFLFPVSSLTDGRMQQALELDGHSVRRVTAYETQAVAAPEDFRSQLDAHTPTVILITSGSAAHALHRHAPDLPAGVGVAAIGRSSARALAEHDVVPHVIASQQTIPGLLDAVAAYLHRCDEKDPA